MNAALAATTFEFKNEVPYTIKGFLERFDAIFTLNQDLLLETHYLHRVLFLACRARTTADTQAWLIQLS